MADLFDHDHNIATSTPPKVAIRLFRLRHWLNSGLLSFLENLSSPLLIIENDPARMKPLRLIVRGHADFDIETNQLILRNLVRSNYQFSDNYHPGPYLFLPPHIVMSLDVSECDILCYNPRLIQEIASLTPKRFIFFLLKKEYNRVRSTVPAPFLDAFNFQQYPAFPKHYDRNIFCILEKSSKRLGVFPFPDMRKFDEDVAQRFRNWAEVPPCSYCGAVLLRGMTKEFCCNPFKNRIRSNFPCPMDEVLLQRIVELTKLNPNFPRILNRDLRPVLHYASVSSPNAAHSNVFISGIPYGLDTYRQFTTPVYAVFCRSDQRLENHSNDIQQLIAYILDRNETLREYMRQRLDVVREIATVSMNEPDEGMNLAIFNAEGIVLNDHEMEVLRTSYHRQKLSQHQMLYDQLVYPLIFWTGSGGCGVVESEQLRGSTTLIRKVLISLILQPRNHFIHQLISLREEFICAISGRLVNIKIKYLTQAERRSFAREDEIRNHNPDNNQKEYGLRTFIPASLCDSDEYWNQVATKCFAISTQLGPPSFFLTFTMNPYWIDYQALKRGNTNYDDSAMTAIIFKMKVSALMKFLDERQVLGKISAFVWRIEYQKRGIPHAHVLLWTDFDTQDINAVEKVINVRYPKNTPFLDDEGMVSDFRQLIDSFQIHHHSKRCKEPTTNCRFGYPQPIAEKTIIHRYKYRFARDANETYIVPHNPALLAHFRCHHCLEIIHSEQCIGYVLKYCSKNSDSGRISVKTVLYEGHAVARDDKLHYYAATRIASSCECFAGICGYWRHHMKPTVHVLAIHLQGKKIVLTIDQDDALKKVDSPSPLERYFGRPIHSSYDHLTYLDYHSLYSIDAHAASCNVEPDVCQPVHFANPRKEPIICILNSVHPKNHELFALRLLLRRFPARSWEELRTHNEIVFPTFHETARQLGLISNLDHEAEVCLQDAVDLNRPPSDIRFLLALMVHYGASQNVLERQFFEHLADVGDNAQSVHYKISVLLNPEEIMFSDYQNDQQIMDNFRQEPNMSELTAEQSDIAWEIIEAVINKNHQLMFLQGSAGTGKTFTVQAIISKLRSTGRKCLICATTGIAAVQYSGGTTLHSLFHLGIDEESSKSFRSNIGRGAKGAQHLLSADLIIIDEVSMLTPWVTNRVSKTLQSISGNEKLEFGGKQILFVGDLLQLPPVVADFSMPVIYRLITRLPYWPKIRTFQLRNPMRAPDLQWAEFLLSIAKGQKHSVDNWMQLQKRFDVTVTESIDEALSFFCSGLAPQDTFPLNRQWICATNKLVNEVNMILHQWRSQEARSFGVVSAFTELIRPLNNCPGFAEAQQIDFIEKIDTPDLPPNEIYILEGDPFILLRNMDTRSGLAKGRRCSAVKKKNRTVVFRFDDNVTRTLTRIPMEKKSNGMIFVRWQLPLRLMFAGTVHKSQGMTLHRAVIDCRSKFWEHGQLYVALSRVKSPSDLCILLPSDTDDLTIRPPVDQEVVTIIESMSSVTETSDIPSVPTHWVMPGTYSINHSYDVSSCDVLCTDTDFDGSDDHSIQVSTCDPDLQDIVESNDGHSAHNSQMLSWIFTGRHMYELPHFNCYGGLKPDFNIPQEWINVSDVFHQVIKSCLEKLLFVVQGGLRLGCQRQFIETLYRIRILISRFLVLYRVRSHIICWQPEPPIQMISQFIGPGLTNRAHICYINAFVQVLFHILPLRYLILAWPNRHPTVEKLYNLFVTMSNHQLANAISLSTIDDPDIPPPQDCSEIAVHILGALHDSASGKLQSTIENLVSFQLITEIWDRSLTDRIDKSLQYMLCLPIFGCSNLIQCLDSYFATVINELDSSETVHRYIRSFPKFFFIRLIREVWNIDHIEKDCRSIAFPLKLNMDAYADQRGSHTHYQLAAVIAHLGDPDPNRGHYITFIRIFGQWILFNDSQVDFVNESNAVEDNFPENEESTQTAIILLYVVDD